MECVLCCSPTGDLSTATSKGIAKIRSSAEARADQDVSQRLSTMEPHMYHRLCYMKYTSAKNISHVLLAKEPNTETQNEMYEEEPAAKRTRTSPKPADVACVFCAQTKKGSSKSKHKFTGDTDDLIKKFVNFEDVINNICSHKENNTAILYHSSCYREYQRRNVSRRVYPHAESQQKPDIDLLSNQTHDTADNNSVLKQLNCVAQLLKKEIDDVGKSNSSAYALPTEAIPKILTSFLSMLLGKDDNSPVVSSLAQDIIYASGYKTTKHAYLACTIRHWTRSRKLVSLLNSMGHCCSYIDTLRMETQQANQILQSFKTTGVHVPENIKRDQFVYFAADNIDFEECVRDGKGTTHGINMIAYQNQMVPSQFQSVFSHSQSHSCQPRSLQLETSQLYGHMTRRFVFPTSSNSKPQPMKPTVAELLPLKTLGSSLVENMSWALLRQTGIDRGIPIPTWGGFHARLKENKSNQPPTTLAYLPMLNEPATDVSSVNKCLTIIETTAKELGQPSTVIFMDQAMYALAKKIIWANPLQHQTTILMMGGFHISMNFLSAIGKMFSKSGWVDILENSGIFSRRVAENLLSAKPYSRCVEAHRAMFEVLTYQKLDSFLLWLDKKGTAVDDLSGWIDSLCEKTFSMSKADLAGNPLIGNRQFVEFDTEMKQKSAVYAWWSQYEYLINLALSHIKAERTGDFQLYLECLESMIPVFFATDRPNYSRWLAVHVCEMKSLPETNHTLYEQFCEGNFVVNRSGASFSSVSPDMALEQTLNRDAKCDGGLVGITKNANARNRWYLTSHMRANVTAELCCMAKLKASDSSTLLQHTDNNYDQQKSTEWPTKLYEYMNLNGFNPFRDKESSTIEQFVTGERVNVSQNERVLTATETGRQQYLTFITKRLIQQDINVQDRITRVNIPFNTKCSKEISSATSKESKCNKQMATFARLALMAMHRPTEVQNIMSLEFEDYPSSIANSDGTLRKSDKSQLRHALQKLISADGENIEQFTVNEATALCIDGMSLVHKVITKDLSTFADLSQNIWFKVRNLMTQFNASRADIVFDTYSTESSLKDHERIRRSNSGMQMISIESNVKIPATSHSWQKFLSNSGNKRSLIRFIKGDWMQMGSQQAWNLRGNEKIVFSSAGLGDQALMYTPHGCSPLVGLENNHEEADTKLILHAKACCVTNNDIVIVCDDTDVLVLLVHFINKWETDKRFWFVTGKSFSNITLVNDIVSVMGESAKNLIGLHCISGCDSVSSIYGVSKSKVMKYGIKEESLSQLGESDTVNSELYIPLIYKLYGCPNLTGTLNALRYKLLAEKGKFGRQLPPTDNVFHFHISRANLQAVIWKQADASVQLVPNILNNGWLKVDDKLQPQYHGGKVASLDNIIACKCKGVCESKRCICRKSQLTCTDICSCPEECQNFD